jgi:hypothetical protein
MPRIGRWDQRAKFRPYGFSSGGDPAVKLERERDNRSVWSGDDFQKSTSGIERVKNPPFLLSPATAILRKTHLPERHREHLTQTSQIERLMESIRGDDTKVSELSGSREPKLVNLRR